MPKTTLSPLTPPQRDAAIQNIIDFFATEREEEIGIIAATDLLDFFLETTGADLYNKGLDDAAGVFKNRLEEALADVELSLKKQK